MNKLDHLIRYFFSYNDDDVIIIYVMFIRMEDFAWFKNARIALMGAKNLITSGAAITK